MDRWEQLAFYPYVFTPLLLIVLILALSPFKGSLLAILFISPLVAMSLFVLFRIWRGQYASDQLHLILSFGIVIFTIFFPYLLIVSSIEVAQYTVLYLSLNFPLFMGHIYSIIYNLSSSKYFQNTKLIDRN